MFQVNAICKDLVLPIKKVSPLNNQTPTVTSVPCASINLLKVIRGACKTSNNNKNVANKLLAALSCCFLIEASIILHNTTLV